MLHQAVQGRNASFQQGLKIHLKEVKQLTVVISQLFWISLVIILNSYGHREIVEGPLKLTHLVIAHTSEVECIGQGTIFIACL